MKSKLTTNWIVIGIFGILLIFQMGCDITKPPPIKMYISEDRSPSWRPDGKWIAYSHTNLDEQDTSYVTGLYVVDTLGENRRLIYEGLALSPDWSPDTKDIVFSNGRLIIVNYRGDNITQITSHGTDYFPSWSPNGATIAFNRSGTQDTVGLWIITLTTMDEDRLWIAGEPDWSPDGSRLVFTMSIVSDGGKTRGEIFVSDLEETTFQQLTDNGETSSSNSSPSWSPDGSQITCNHEGEVWLMTYDGKDQQKLTDGFDPAWSPESKRIVFSKETDDKIVLYTINTDGTNLEQLTF